jgi:hypothetical protein
VNRSGLAQQVPRSRIVSDVNDGLRAGPASSGT